MYEFTKLSEEKIIKLITDWDLNFKDIPEEYRTEYICLEAVNQNAQALEHVNKNLIDRVLENFPHIKFFNLIFRKIICEKINDEWLFTISCQKQISKDKFLERIYSTNGGLEKNPHRKKYLNILKQF